MNGECGQMPGMGMKGITRKNGRGLLLAGLNVGTWESGMYVCERSIQSGRRGADGLYTDGVVSSCIFYFFVGTKWSGGCDGFGGTIGEKRGRKAEEISAELMVSAAKNKNCFLQKIVLQEHSEKGHKSWEK